MMKHDIFDNLMKYLRNTYVVLGIGVFALLAYWLISLKIADGLIAIIFGFIGVSFCYLISRLPIKEKYFFIGFLTVSFFLRLFIIFAIQTPLESDFKYLFHAASELANGNNVMFEGPFVPYPYQSGIVLFHAMFLKLWNHVLTLKIVNSICSVILCGIVYATAKLFVKNCNARFAAMAYSLFLFPLLYNTIIANQIPGAVFFYLGIYILLKAENITWKHACLSAILFVIGNILRPEGILFLGSAVGYFILICRKETIRKTLFCIAILCITYIGLGQSASFMAKSIGVNSYGFVNNQPKWKFVLGLNTQTCGGWNKNDLQYSTEEKQEEIIKERLASLTLRHAYDLVKCKETTAFSSGALFWSLGFLDDDKVVYGVFIKDWKPFLTSWNNQYYGICFVLAVLGMTMSFRKQKLLLFFNILVLNFIAYALVEVQPRYAYLLHIALFVFVACGMENAVVLWKKSVSKIMSVCQKQKSSLVK